MTLLGSLGPRLAAVLRRTGHPSIDRVATWLDRRPITGRIGREARQDAADEMTWITLQRYRTLVDVHEPLVLISQVHRSGGTLLLRLLDGHPQLHVMPHELGRFIPDRPIPPDRRDAWSLLHDPKLEDRLRRGLRQQQAQLNQDESIAGFLLPPSLHRRLYKRITKFSGDTSERGLANAYVTAYFNAWLDYRGLRDAGRSWAVGFEPMLNTQPARLSEFWRIYPDGRLITILRDPVSWYASARRWDRRFEHVDLAMSLWEASARATEEQLGDPRVLALLFDELVESTEPTMQRVARFLGIEFEPSLLMPTANGVAFGANSSFESGDRGEVGTRASRASLVPPDEQERIRASVGDVYDRVRAAIEARASAARG